MYFSPSNQQTLKQGVLTKRSQGKSKILTTCNYKSRLFVLTPEELSYYDGTEEKKGKQKGTIALSKIKVVESVDDDALDRKFCFQVQHDNLILYIIANSEEERNEWVTSLRYEISQQNRLLLENFHSGLYINGSWSCCKCGKNSQGCKKTHFATNVFDPSQGADIPKPPSMPLPPVPDEKKNGDAVDESKFMKVMAVFDFKALQPGDLSLTKDQEYTILDKAQPHWWMARDSMGNEGFIPSNYVRMEIGLEGQRWFHGDLSRQETEDLLKLEGKDGVFLVKNSSRPGMYTLSLSFQGDVKHYHIKLTDEGKYFVSPRHAFENIIKLVEYHKLNCAGLVTRLRFPYTNQGGGPPTPVLGHDIFEIAREEISFGRQLGAGQFGTVYEGVWKGNHRIAIKMMKEGTMSEDDFIEEAKVMSKFYHKNLVKLFGVCSKARPICIVTELMTNGSLLEYLRNNRMLLDQLNTILNIIFQVVCAMEYLEEQQFIHRDLAARNCLVGERNIVKVADFGLARHVTDDEYTASEGTKFPIKWAAPEVIHYTRFSSKSDVWAYGILCWEVFSGGKTPYPGRQNIQVAEDIMTGYRMEIPAKCPRYVYDIVTRCWEAEPDQRPSFSQLFSELQVLIEDYTET
ncbi:tyrosine-protein kinase Tec-like [Rhopilema esculentum]|uniref:tyrosine-protein kinase Tec-like n=1 Tax=Rhopilema esculentum TaxID=499914 RepID=UPI0031D86905